MAKRGLVHCRICKKAIDRNVETDWTCPSVNYFYHTDCYDKWVARKEDVTASATEEEWLEALKYYLAHVIKAPIDYKKMMSQWRNYLKQKKTAKGIYFAIRYFYDVQKGNAKNSQGGIGIVSSIYEESCAYWYEREAEEEGLIARIEQQIKQHAVAEVIVLKQGKGRRSIRNKAINISEIEDWED